MSKKAQSYRSVVGILAYDMNNNIGDGSRIPWTCTPDTVFFSTLTKGNVVIMGKGTFDSIAGRPLPDRFNIIITHDDLSDKLPDNAISVDNIETALSLAQSVDLYDYTHVRCTKDQHVFFIGGENLGLQMLDDIDYFILNRVNYDDDTMSVSTGDKLINTIQELDDLDVINYEGKQRLEILLDQLKIDYSSLNETCTVVQTHTYQNKDPRGPFVMLNPQALFGRASSEYILQRLYCIVWTLRALSTLRRIVGVSELNFHERTVDTVSDLARIVRKVRPEPLPEGEGLLDEVTTAKDVESYLGSILHGKVSKNRLRNISKSKRFLSTKDNFERVMMDVITYYSDRYQNPYGEYNWDEQTLAESVLLNLEEAFNMIGSRTLTTSVQEALGLKD